MITLHDVARDLYKNDNIVIYPHVNIDGDALGSATALCLALRQLGKNAWVLYDKDIPINLDFLAINTLITSIDEIPKPGLSLMIDCEGYKRIDGRQDAFDMAPVKGCVDHHEVSEMEIDYDFYYCEPYSAATGELSYLLIKELGATIDLDIANAIFTAITMDTGNFQHSNTTARSHEIVASLYDVPGFDSKAISALLYDRKPKSIVALESIVLQNLEYYADGEVCVGVITQDILAQTGASLANVDDLVTMMLAIEGVELAALIKEEEEFIKLSLRALSRANVAEVAQTFGGGGHLRAAGFRSKLNMAELKDKLIPVLVQAVQ